MDCREAQSRINQFIDDDMEEKELAEFIEHVKNCPSCYDDLEVTYTVLSVVRLLEDSDEDTDLLKALDHKIIEKEDWLRQQHRRSLTKKTFGAMFCVIGLFLVVGLSMFNLGKGNLKGELLVSRNTSTYTLFDARERNIQESPFLFMRQRGKVHLLPTGFMTEMDLFNSEKVTEPLESRENYE
ncbi:MAG: zf-HC2 domain-containing protein [Clostridia bacterium]|nr:zf-HC2 domain-containing protein [Clostridia bacterium]NCD03454.1 zf-HC2 domain-containing protein [Clostridia bacterium]